MTRLIGLPLVAGLGSALLFLSLAKGVAAGVLLSYAAPLPLMMAGLGWGGLAAGAASLVGLAAVAAVAGALSALPFAVVAVLPALVVVNRALLWRSDDAGRVEWYPPGLVLAWLAGTAGLMLVVAAALIPGHEAGIEGWLAETIGSMLKVLAPSLSEEQRGLATQWWTPLFPSMLAGSWLVMAVVNAATAQGILVRSGRNRRPSPVYRQLWLPTWLGAALLAAVLVGWLAGGDPGYVGRNLALVAVVPFAFLGLAGVHQWAAGRSNANWVLAVTYLVLFVAFGWAVLAVAGLGLVRFVSGFRDRAISGGGKEE
ncbi:MAG: hypothetical protein ACM31L_14220 [Actinomycetota bacterium]